MHFSPRTRWNNEGANTDRGNAQVLANSQLADTHIWWAVFLGRRLAARSLAKNTNRANVTLIHTCPLVRLRHKFQKPSNDAAFHLVARIGPIGVGSWAA